MALKFAANLNFLFTEKANSIAERIRLAHQNGFRAVEIPYPEGETQEVLATLKDTGMTVSLVNIAFDRTKDELKFGSASIPGAEQLFSQQLNDTIDFARNANCQKIHLMSGIISGGLEADHAKTYSSNLKLAADSLKTYQMIGVIEPINKYAIATYYMNSYAKASQVLTQLGCNNLKLLVDLYHLQHIQGNVTKTLEEHRSFIGHFQIAQVPNRHEPDTAGELDYGYVFKALQDFGYEDWVGCEYRPKTTTVEGLGWLNKFGYKF